MIHIWALSGRDTDNRRYTSPLPFLSFLLNASFENTQWSPLWIRSTVVSKVRFWFRRMASSICSIEWCAGIRYSTESYKEPILRPTRHNIGHFGGGPFGENLRSDISFVKVLYFINEIIIYLCYSYGILIESAPLFLKRNASVKYWFTVQFIVPECLCCIDTAISGACATNNGGCHSQAFCRNTQGSRTCTCESGFTGTGINCAGAWMFFFYREIIFSFLP